MMKKKIRTLHLLLNFYFKQFSLENRCGSEEEWVERERGRVASGEEGRDQVDCRKVETRQMRRRTRRGGGSVD